MRILDILNKEQVAVEPSGAVRSKADAIDRLSELLGGSQNQVGVDEVKRVLTDRERLQSTGVGGGVAIPHGSIERLERIYGALLLCRGGIAFDAIDGAPVSILFAVIGPKRSTGEHLKTLARVSRVLRDEAFRNQLLAASSSLAAFELIELEERRLG